MLPSRTVGSIVAFSVGLLFSPVFAGGECDGPLFADDVLYGAGAGPYSTAIGNLNGDGALDLAVANLGDNVSVLLNQGDGTFAADVLYEAGDTLISIAIGDLNGDSTPDLAVANTLSNNTSVLLNQCEFPPSLPGDLNNDGTVDGADLCLLLGAFNSSDPDADLNGDGTVDGADLGILLSAWSS